MDGAFMAISGIVTFMIVFALLRLGLILWVKHTNRDPGPIQGCDTMEVSQLRASASEAILLGRRPIPGEWALATMQVMGGLKNFAAVDANKINSNFRALTERLERCPYCGGARRPDGAGACMGCGAPA